jgi:hypothetical protein
MASDLAKVESAVGADIIKRLGDVVEVAIVVNSMLFGGRSTVASDLAELAKMDSAIGVGVGGSWLRDVKEFDILNTSGAMAMVNIGGIP